ncbi:MAG: hypothetical protein ACI9EV_001425 [Urechidicola sp.]|jgi:hypothetical protein
MSSPTMKNARILLLSTIVLISIVSCKKDGCTDCNATNFSTEADKDDGTCEYINEDILGTYAVQDSITGPPTMEWYHSSYDLIILRSVCSPSNLIFSNYANNSFNGFVYGVDCQITNENITIVPQEVNGDNVRSSVGYFSNDSIYFDIEFENEFGEVFYGKCFGVKE